MDNTYESGAIGTPTPPPALPSNGNPTDGVFGSVAPTNPGAYWFFMVTTEILNVITAGGLTPARGTLTQLRDAIIALVANAFSTIASLGATGYIRFPGGGFTIQWGSMIPGVGTGSGTGNYSYRNCTQTFPRAFSTCYQVVASGYDTNGSGGLTDAGAVVMNAQSATAFTAFYAGADAGPITIRWIAVGVS